MENDYKMKVELWFSVDTLHRLEDVADKEGISVEKLITRLVESTYRPMKSCEV